MKTIYTAIFGDYDELKQPFFVPQHWRFVCFTDQDIIQPAPAVWEIVKVPVMACGPIKTARYYKIMFHKHIETQFSMWLDATFYINTDLNRWWKRFKPPFTTLDHPFDDCIYTDIISCMKGGKCDPGVLARQFAHYEDIGLPKHNGLVSSGILMREKTEQAIRFCEEWWSQVEQWSSRDQVAFGYTAWRMPGIIETTEWNYTTQKEFIHLPHKHKINRDEKKLKILSEYGSKKR
jgi:hypothetical protein